MYELDLLVPLRRRVWEGMPYVGSSAGSNFACPTIRSTNDMPIVEPPSLTALGLVPFNLNPHYLDPDPASTHKGETREERIAQFHEENGEPAVGLREGAILRIEGRDRRAPRNRASPSLPEKARRRPISPRAIGSTSCSCRNNSAKSVSA
jgi:peptidase E